MTSDTHQVLSRDEVSGLLAALDDAEPLVRIAVLRALVRLSLDADAERALRPHRAAVERHEYAWSTRLPDAADLARLESLLDDAQAGNTARAQELARSAQSTIVRRFAQLSLRPRAPLSDDMLAEAQDINAKAERSGPSSPIMRANFAPLIPAENHPRGSCVIFRKGPQAAMHAAMLHGIL